MKKLAIITTHPIQYYAPIFSILQLRKNIAVNIYYTLGKREKLDRGFQKAVSWDIPLLDGYDYEWAENVSTHPETHSFNGIINPQLRQHIENSKPDAILIYGWANKSHLKIMRYFKGKIPVYFRGDSVLLAKPAGLKNLLRTIFLKWVYSHVDHAFYVGTNNKDYFLKYGLKENELSFAPHAIDNERFGTDRGDEAADLRKLLKLKDDDILILFAGKFEPVKNVTLLLSAFLQLKNDKLHLLLTGNGMEETKLKATAASAGNVHFLDFKNQTYMPVLYQAADLFCLPSKNETWGLAINEAMACAKAVLASDTVGCAVDLVVPGQNGDIFTSGNAVSLRQKLSELTGNRQRLREMGRQSALIIKDWDFLHIAKAFENKLLNETN